MSPEVAGLPVLTRTVPGLAEIWYSTIGVPPSKAGAVQLTVAPVAPVATALTAVGGSGLGAAPSAGAAVRTPAERATARPAPTARRRRLPDMAPNLCRMC